MRKVVVAAVLAAGMAVLATAAWGSSKAPQSASSASAAGSALIKCGKTRSIGLMAPFTGPAASIGINQVHWATAYKNTYNRTHKTKIKFVNEDTQLGAANGTAEAVKGARALASNSEPLTMWPRNDGSSSSPWRSVGLERGLANWPAMRPTFTTGTPIE